ncbi:hypothetical protein F4861DRAFT_545636 [Xylaria intraflava]|nr:hypothetical protein F4861DRAFT_545636 [Xylaria intraflava]
MSPEDLPAFNSRLVPKLFVQPKTGLIRRSLVLAAFICSAQCLVAITTFLWLDGLDSPPYFLSDSRKPLSNSALPSNYPTNYQGDGHTVAKKWYSCGVLLRGITFSVISIAGLCVFGMAWKLWSGGEARIKKTEEKQAKAQ